LKLKIRIILNTNRTHTRKNQQKKARCMRAHALTVRHVLLSKLEGKENVDTCRCHGRKREQIGAWSRIGPIGGEGYTTILPTAPSRRSGGCRVSTSLNYDRGGSDDCDMRGRFLGCWLRHGARTPSWISQSTHVYITASERRL
jgi:hypothetical protein